jgi:hypothetical protein
LSPSKRNTSLSVGERDLATAPALVTCKTYAMPWQTCSACPRYPFHSLLLIDPPPLWQPHPKVSHAATSCASPLQSPQSLQHEGIHQNPRNHISNLMSGISRILSWAMPTPSQIQTSPRKPPLNLSYSQVIKTSPNLRAYDPGKHQVTQSPDLSHDPVTSRASRDQPAHDHGKLSGDLPKDWSPIQSRDCVNFGNVTRPLINTWKTVGRINKETAVNQVT